MSRFLIQKNSLDISQNLKELRLLEILSMIIADLSTFVYLYVMSILITITSWNLLLKRLRQVISELNLFLNLYCPKNIFWPKFLTPEFSKPGYYFLKKNSYESLRLAILSTGIYNPKILSNNSELIDEE